MISFCIFFFFNDTATTEIYTLSLHDALPILYDPNAKLGNYTVAPTNGNLTVQYAQGGICLASSGHQILQPVNADGSSVFKKGSTIPVTFRVCDANANPIGGAGQVVTVWNQNWPVLYWKSSGAGAIDEEILSTTPDTQFRWDDTAQQWVFNLNSKNLTAGMIYTYRIYLNEDRKSTRLNSSHSQISYAVFCLKKKKINMT